MHYDCIFYINILFKRLEVLFIKIKRTIANHLKELAQQFSAVAVLGPRQSGKTTLVKETFPNYAYITLEDIDKKMLQKLYTRT